MTMRLLLRRKSRMALESLQRDCPRCFLWGLRASCVTGRGDLPCPLPSLLGEGPGAGKSGCVSLPGPPGLLSQLPVTLCLCLGVPGNPGILPSWAHKNAHSKVPWWGSQTPGAGGSSKGLSTRAPEPLSTVAGGQTFNPSSREEKPLFVASAVHFHAVNTANMRSANSELGRDA